MNNKWKFLIEYDEVVLTTISGKVEIICELDTISSSIRNHIDELDTQFFSKRNHLMLALRFMECFRILEWIKVSLFCGAYDSVYRDLRYIIDAMIQAYFLDKNIFSGTLKAKFEAFKVFESYRGSMGKKLMGRIKDLPYKKKIKELHTELSNYVHPSGEMTLYLMESSANRDPWDRLKKNIYNESLLKDCLDKTKKVIDYFLEINKHFEKYFLKKINSKKT